MPIHLSTEHIASLWSALNRPVPTMNLDRAATLLRKVASDGWASPADVENIFFASDRRLDREVDLEAIATALGLPWRGVYRVPKSRSNSVIGETALEAADVAELLIQLERLGFLVDPTPLVEVLLPKIRAQTKIMESELSIFWYAKHRHRMEALTIQGPEKLSGLKDIQHLKMVHGYKAELWTDESGGALMLSVTAPKHRVRREPVKTICPDCGYKWCRGDPDSSASHRQEHKRRMKILRPSPHR